MAADPLVNVDKVDESSDIRRQRRALSADELLRLMEAIPDQYKAVYRFMLNTGLRRQEVEDLQWGDVRLDSPAPFLKLRPKATKSRRADTLPLRGDVAAELRTMRGDAGDGDRVFDRTPAMDEHRNFLAAAGIPYKDEQGYRFDFHAGRHTYGTLLSKAGVSPREAMELMRHSDLRLTMKVYTDPRLFDLAGAVEKLPKLDNEPEQQANLLAAGDVTPLSDGGKVDFRRTKRRTSPSAVRYNVRHGSATMTGCSDSSLNPLSDMNLQQKSPIGRDGGKARQVGLEPTTSRLTAGCSTIELLPNGPPMELTAAG